MVLLVPTLDNIVVPRPEPTEACLQNLCADAGYKGQPARDAALSRKYTPQVKQRREEADAKRRPPDYKARRWVVERTHSWVNRFRKLLASFEKTKASCLGLLNLAAAMICRRRTLTIHG
jgi:putative transposase